MNPFFPDPPNTRNADDMGLPPPMTPYPSQQTQPTPTPPSALERVSRATEPTATPRTEHETWCEPFGGDQVVAADFARQLERELADAKAALAATVELHTLQMAAVMTATVQNTETSIKDRIDRGHPYWSQAYADVCAAVDREMAHRSALAAERALADRLAVELKFYAKLDWKANTETWQQPALAGLAAHTEARKAAP